VARDGRRRDHRGRGPHHRPETPFGYRAPELALSGPHGLGICLIANRVGRATVRFETATVNEALLLVRRYGESLPNRTSLDGVARCEVVAVAVQLEADRSGFDGR